MRVFLLPMLLQYSLDENVDSTYIQQLRRQFPELVVSMIGEPATPARGTLDPEI